MPHLLRVNWFIKALIERLLNKLNQIGDYMLQKVI